MLSLAFRLRVPSSSFITLLSRLPCDASSCIGDNRLYRCDKSQAFSSALVTYTITFSTGGPNSAQVERPSNAVSLGLVAIGQALAPGPQPLSQSPRLGRTPSGMTIADLENGLSSAAVPTVSKSRHTMSQCAHGRR